MYVDPLSWALILTGWLPRRPLAALLCKTPSFLLWVMWLGLAGLGLALAGGGSMGMIMFVVGLGLTLLPVIGLAGRHPWGGAIIIVLAASWSMVFQTFVPHSAFGPPDATRLWMIDFSVRAIDGLDRLFSPYVSLQPAGDAAIGLLAPGLNAIARRVVGGHFLAGIVVAALLQRRFAGADSRLKALAPLSSWRVPRVVFLAAAISGAMSYGGSVSAAAWSIWGFSSALFFGRGALLARALLATRPALVAMGAALILLWPPVAFFVGALGALDTLLPLNAWMDLRAASEKLANLDTRRANGFQRGLPLFGPLVALAPLGLMIALAPPPPGRGQHTPPRLEPIPKPYRMMVSIHPLEAPGFLMERYEGPGLPDSLPTVGITASEAAERCAKHSGRLCRVEEWQAACSDDGRHPFLLDSRKHSPKGDHKWDLSKTLRNACALSYRPGKLELANTGAHQDCVSAHGIYDLIGNAYEWVQAPGGRWGLMGGTYTQADLLLSSCEHTVLIPPAAMDALDLSTVGYRCCRDFASRKKRAP